MSATSTLHCHGNVMNQDDRRFVFPFAATLIAAAGGYVEATQPLDDKLSLHVIVTSLNPPIWCATFALHTATVKSNEKTEAFAEFRGLGTKRIKYKCFYIMPVYAHPAVDPLPTHRTTENCNDQKMCFDGIQNWDTSSLKTSLTHHEISERTQSNHHGWWNTGTHQITRAM